MPRAANFWGVTKFGSVYLIREGVYSDGLVNPTLLLNNLLDTNHDSADHDADEHPSFTYEGGRGVD